MSFYDQRKKFLGFARFRYTIYDISSSGESYHFDGIHCDARWNTQYVRRVVPITMAPINESVHNVSVIYTRTAPKTKTK